MVFFLILSKCRFKLSNIFLNKYDHPSHTPSKKAYLKSRLFAFIESESARKANNLLSMHPMLLTLLNIRHYNAFGDI